MPTYEYACRDCDQHVEVVQSFRDDPLTTCGVCGGSLRKVFSAAGIIFKGSGYYVTDSRKPPAGSETKQGEKPAAKSGAKSGETKPGETKPGETKPGETKSGEKSGAKSETKADSTPDKKAESA